MEKLYLIKASLQNDIERLLKIRMQKMLEIYEAAKITILADCNEKLNCIVRGRQGFIQAEREQVRWIKSRAAQSGSHSH